MLKCPSVAENGQSSDLIVHPMDLTKIVEKQHTYDSLYELYTDVQWILHNCTILYPGAMNMCYSIAID